MSQGHGDRAQSWQNHSHPTQCCNPGTNQACGKDRQERGDHIAGQTGTPAFSTQKDLLWSGLRTVVLSLSGLVGAAMDTPGWTFWRSASGLGLVTVALVLQGMQWVPCYEGCWTHERRRGLAESGSEIVPFETQPGHGPGSRRGRGLGVPHVSLFVGSELMCAKLHCASLNYLWENHTDSAPKASRALLAFIHGNMKFHSNLWCTSPLPHYLKCGFTLKIACIKLASASLADRYIPCAKSENWSSGFNGKKIFHMLLFRVDGAEAQLHSCISGSSSTALPFWP